MSSYPYRNDPGASRTFGLKTEFMLINADGTGLRQLTHFNVPGYPESFPHGKGAVAACGMWSPDRSRILAYSLRFPDSPRTPRRVCRRNRCRQSRLSLHESSAVFAERKATFYAIGIEHDFWFTPRVKEALSRGRSSVEREWAKWSRPAPRSVGPWPRIGVRRGPSRLANQGPHARGKTVHYRSGPVLSSSRNSSSAGVTTSACVQVTQCGPSFTVRRRAPWTNLAVRSPDAPMGRIRSASP